MSLKPRLPNFGFCLIALEENCMDSCEIEFRLLHHDEHKSMHNVWLDDITMTSQ